jgi:hypothetical protein
MQDDVLMRECDFCGEPVQVIILTEDGRVESRSKDYLTLDGMTICIDCLHLAGYELHHTYTDAVWYGTVNMN